ncbi:MAG: tripartite tricarboxylate transporter permease [Candidatus Diapherotrites archaeon]
MIELIQWLLFGFIAGCFTGLTPGIHANNLAALALFLSFANPITAAVFILSAGITHSFVDIIPAIYLGAPEDETIFSALAGHRFFLEGRGIYAVRLALIGSLFAGIISIIIALPLFSFLVNFFELISFLVPSSILLALTLTVFEKQNINSVKSNLIVVFLSGFLGISCMNLNFEALLIAGITGFFGAGNAVISVLFPPKIKEQKNEFSEFDLIDSIKFASFASFLGAFTAVMPSISAGQSALIGKKIAGKMKPENYMVFVGGLNTSTQLLSMIVLFAVGKTRTGIAKAVSGLIELDLGNMLLLLAVSIACFGLAFFAAEFFSVNAGKIIPKINYKAVNLGILGFLALINLFFGGTMGLIVFASATAIGTYCILSSAKRSAMMAFLMLPTFLIYLNLMH